MISKHKYDLHKYPFAGLISELFNGVDLQHIERYEDVMRSGWDDLVVTYRSFVRDIIAPIMGENERLIYQKWPTFRVQLKDNVAVGGWHRDLDYNHPIGETNFVIAITPMFESNTIISELTPGKMDFRQMDMNPGEFTRFNGNQCIHGNLPNKTGVSRVSIDFRVLRPKDYNPNHSPASLSKGHRFLIGDYYEELFL
ncbi:MAG: hypothetical protein GKR95_24860 [Gammaproteobacteria bacterium]|nr:hypothetical protein [Gammaproteobacteria bacterium]